jgi:hypothetical protein
MIQTAADLLYPGETALVLFTRGTQFQQYANGTGSTGYWKARPDKAVDWVIVYHRQEDRSNVLYKARPVAYNGPDAEKRYLIQLTDVAEMGTTKTKWFAFADTHANPVRYLTKG